jgi:L-ascorbate metabolism protein UlaG (beta-lactamase superfamily)
MKLTKYEHACLVLEDQGKKLIIDPGSFTATFGDLTNVVAVVVTHVHADHYSTEHLEMIISQNPDVQIFTTTEVANKFPRPVTTIVSHNTRAEAGPFGLLFLGDMHKEIHESLSRPHNIGVMVNDTFFYPGDAFTVPEIPVATLAVPANAPWASVRESMDYIAAVKPSLCLPTHDGLLSENGHMVYNASLNHACKLNDVKFQYLQPGDSIEI